MPHYLYKMPLIQRPITVYKTRSRTNNNTPIRKSEPFINPFLSDYNSKIYTTSKSNNQELYLSTKNLVRHHNQKLDHQTWRKIAWSPLLIKKSAYSSKFVHYSPPKSMKLEMAITLQTRPRIIRHSSQPTLVCLSPKSRERVALPDSNRELRSVGSLGNRKRPLLLTLMPTFESPIKKLVLSECKFRKFLI